MNIYHITRMDDPKGNHYEEAVICASSKESARKLAQSCFNGNKDQAVFPTDEHVICDFIGVGVGESMATEKIVMFSFLDVEKI